MKVTWSDKKREQVRRDHGIDLAKIDNVFEDPFAVYIEDSYHSTETETRFKAIGLSAPYGLVFVVFTHAADELRLITARRAENWMVKEYEENRKRL